MLHKERQTFEEVVDTTTGIQFDQNNTCIPATGCLIRILLSHHQPKLLYFLRNKFVSENLDYK